MTAFRDDPAMAGEGTTSVVRPLRARVVRREHAERHVSRMFDALPPSARPPGHLLGRAPAATFDPGVYEEAAESLYVYRLRRGDQHHLGIVGEVSVEAFLDGRVRGHEAVQPDRVEALVAHLASAPVRSELVALLHKSGPAVESAIAESQHSEPLVEFTGPDDWQQTVWRVPAAAHVAVCEELGRGVHYIADGHHRVAASLEVWRRNGGSAEGLMSVVYDLAGLELLAFHRRVVGPVRGDGLLTVLAGSFTVREIDHPDEFAGCFGVYVEGRWYDATYRSARPAGAAGLDVTILDEQVLGPLLGPRPTSAQLEITSALTPLGDLAGACDRDGGALFAMRPPSLDQLFEVADRGEVMPPKTTYFDPKPYAGVFLR
jgi:uncharacterized protein (DUF1015 family)